MCGVTWDLPTRAGHAHSGRTAEQAERVFGGWQQLMGVFFIRSSYWAFYATLWLEGQKCRMMKTFWLQRGTQAEQLSKFTSSPLVWPHFLTICSPEQSKENVLKWCCRCEISQKNGISPHPIMSFFCGTLVGTSSFYDSLIWALFRYLCFSICSMLSIKETRFLRSWPKHLYEVQCFLFRLSANCIMLQACESSHTHHFSPSAWCK